MTATEKEFISSLNALMIRYDVKLVYKFGNYIFSNCDEELAPKIAVIYLNISKIFDVINESKKVM